MKPRAQRGVSARPDQLGADALSHAVASDSTRREMRAVLRCAISADGREPPVARRRRFDPSWSARVTLLAAIAATVPFATNLQEFSHAGATRAFLTAQGGSSRLRQSEPTSVGAAQKSVQSKEIGAMRLTNLAGVVAVGVSSAYGAVGQPNLLQNGGFEVGPGQADCTWVVHGVSPEFVPGWSVIAVSVDRERLSSSCPATTESWTSFDGEFTIDLDGGDAGGAIAQTVTTVPGRHYRLSFQLTGNCAPGTKSMRVEVAGVTAQFDHVCQSQNPQPWSEKSVDFVAIGKITTVVLRSLSTSGRNGPVIDAVQLVEVVDTCPADVDESGAVNGVDLAAVLNNWGTNGGKYPRADINGDGVVNASDLAAVLGAWGPCP